MQSTVTLYSPIKRIIIDALYSRNDQLKSQEIELQRPRDVAHGDIAIPCFQFAKLLKQSPQQIAQDVAQTLDAHPLVITAQAV